MSTRRLVFAWVLALVLSAETQAANFTYHGELLDGDAPAEGKYDLRVRALAQPGASKALAAPTEVLGMLLHGGRFSVELELPEDPDGVTWVDVAIRKSGSGNDYETLGDPQPISKANSTCPGAWALDGNTGMPSGSFLGTADADALDFRVNNRRVMHIEANGSDAPSIVNGSPANVASSMHKGQTIAGGGEEANNSCGSSGAESCRNQTTEAYSTVGGGKGNRALGEGSVVAGGVSGRALGHWSAVLGGRNNDALGNDSAVGGGLLNKAVGQNSFVGGGQQNRANGKFAVVGGGVSNAANAYASSVGGGSGNCAGGDLSWSGGFRAIVRSGNGVGDVVCDSGNSGDFDGDEGTFVWADTSGEGFKSTGPNQFLVRADGGLMLNTTQLPATGDDLVIGARAVSGDADADLAWRTRLGKAGRIFLADSDGHFAWNSNDLSGANFLTFSNGAHLTAGGVFTNASSRDLKHDFKAVDVDDMLARVLSLPITSWQYRASPEGRHVGPVAEDFRDIFALSGDGKSISTVDADGVALAAIQGLNAKLEAENATLRAGLESVMARLQQLETRTRD